MDNRWEDCLNGMKRLLDLEWTRRPSDETYLLKWLWWLMVTTKPFPRSDLHRNYEKFLDDVIRRQRPRWWEWWLPSGPFHNDDDINDARIHLETYKKLWASLVITRAIRRGLGKMNRKATIIQRACQNWIDKPITADGKLGITARLAERKYA